MLKQLWSDENGVILSAELVLVGTILILGMIVGLVELQCGIVAELSDLGDAIGNVDQSYRIPGMTSYKPGGSIKAQTSGASFRDGPDAGDCNAVISCDNAIGYGEKRSSGQDGSGIRRSGPPGGFRRDDGRPQGPDTFHRGGDDRRPGPDGPRRDDFRRDGDDARRGGDDARRGGDDGHRDMRRGPGPGRGPREMDRPDDRRIQERRSEHRESREGSDRDRRRPGEGRD